MYLAYLDESGDSGVGPTSPTRFFVLSCILIDEAVWLAALDALVDLRRQLKANYGLPTRDEIKAGDFVRGRGPFTGAGTSRSDRMDIYRFGMQYQAANIPLQAFSVAIDKGPAGARGWDARFAAWTFALQRINRFCGGTAYSAIFPDEGHGHFIKRRIRHMRRYHVVSTHWGPGTISFPLHRIIEDPNERRSHDSYFIQLADWNAYATHRSIYIDPLPTVPGDLWDELAGVHLAAVNSVRGGPPAIVKYP